MRRRSALKSAAITSVEATTASCESSPAKPLDLADRVALGLGIGQQPIPGPVPAPAGEAVVAGLPGSVALGQIAPRSPRTQLPQDAVHHLAVVAPPAAASSVFWQQRCDPGPSLVGELTLLEHRLRPPRLVECSMKRS